jgi:hypothetical protein
VVGYLWGYSTASAFFFARKEGVAMRPESAASRWETLQVKAHLPEVQAIIRREISRGEIRVAPAPGGGIRIIPELDTSPVEESESSAAAGLAYDDEDAQKVPIPLIRRRTP